MTDDKLTPIISRMNPGMPCVMGGQASMEGTWMGLVRRDMLSMEGADSPVGGPRRVRMLFLDAGELS